MRNAIALALERLGYKRFLQGFEIPALVLVQKRGRTSRKFRNSVKLYSSMYVALVFFPQVYFQNQKSKSL